MIYGRLVFGTSSSRLARGILGGFFLLGLLTAGSAKGFAQTTDKPTAPPATHR